MLMKTDLVL